MNQNDSSSVCRRRVSGPLIPLVMDDRECRGPIPRLLLDSGVFEVETRRLEVGDYVLDHVLLVERKTLGDFAASIKDGRAFRQALRLAQASRPAVLILEGRGRDLIGCGLGWGAIQGALINISLFVGLPILRSRSAADTVRTMGFIARQRQVVATGALVRHGQRPRNKKALQNHILQGFPGIGPERAKRLLEHFGSVGAVVGAGSDSLRSVKGIGPRTAQRLVWSIEEPAARYGHATTYGRGAASDA